MPTSFWRLPAIAHEEADELRRWSSLGLEAARRAAEAKAKPKKKKAPPKA
jgi:TfoX/Sxy family transcriptional regulator of competence genes